ncbi:hypothetical protein TTHERM_00372520 (macronuclear) [Tetrahymena thermophila SB210]|uniref:Zinc carboxypeptidase family protein n=1 Tax=Tetrahymena thermophila (strain SB210) TaxID=312017 RepID=I7MHR5_TETTS|nr:hypothetical protein TTHERM_00372520 [Tetrahymena thermophila SB210]EAR89335.1 hypothetical protein TTHERM_00372520 [Tetrahymena thermophila SB210]|eukprot:XP_001009580.1 hypothetical protein TTHERM_00372520 [Tetrahymena thermophila SB210]
MDKISSPDLSESEKILHQNPYKSCPQHPNRKIEYIYNDSQKKKYLCCCNCVINKDIQQNRLICIQDILESNETSIFQNWPFTDSQEDQSFKQEVEKMIQSSSQSCQRAKQIEDFFNQMAKRVEETIIKTKKNMLAKLNSLFNYEQRIQEEYCIYSGQQNLKDIAKQIEQSYEEKTQSLKQTFEYLQKIKKTQQQKIQEIIKQSNKEQSQLNLEQPKKMEELILKYIEKIDCFENKQSTANFQFDTSKNSNSQIILKLINNRFNNCPDNFLVQIRQKIEFLSDYFNDLEINEEWKQNLYQNDLDKLKTGAFKMFEHMTQMFLKQNTSNNLDKSSSYIQDRDNLESIINLISNPFNYCREKYKVYLIQEFNHLAEYLSVLKIPRQYETQEARDLHEKVLELQEPVFKEVSELLIKLNPKLNHNEKLDLQQRKQRLEKNFENPNQGLVQEPLLSKLKEFLQNMPQIYITLFYKDQTMYDFPLSINSYNLSEKQINMINTLTRKIQENKKNNIQISALTNHFLSFLNCYKNYNGHKDYTYEIIKNIPIFDSFFEMQVPVYKNKVKLEFESKSYGLEKQGIVIQRQNMYGQNSICIQKQSDSCVFSNILNTRTNYIIQVKFSEAIGTKYFQFGFEEMTKLQQKLNAYDCFFITSLNKDYVEQIRGNKQYLADFIQYRDQIEIRACFTKKIIYLTDFPSYNFIYQIKLNNFSSDQISFVIRIGTSVKEYQIHVTDCYQVDEYLLQYFEQQ